MIGSVYAGLKKKIKSLLNDPEQCAAAASLVYVNSSEQGILRHRHGKGFSYTLDNAKISDRNILSRIKSLVIPPAWRQVWICSLPNGHLQATGFDAKNRRQYLYHPLWTALRGETKFMHLQDFGRKLPEIRRQVKADLALNGLPLKKVLATIVSVIDQTGIRIGSSAYEKLYGSFGLTTMQNQHVTVSGTKAVFSFKGKKGVFHNITLKSRKLAQIIRRCLDIPGRELFQYFDENGERKKIDSGMVNDYIREISGDNFTSKDFRTWVGTVCALETFRDAGAYNTDAELKRKVAGVVDVVAQRLGNTRTVCKKYYIHPAVIEHYTEGTLMKFFSPSPNEAGELSAEEIALMKILEIH
ncbi:MAG: topoisomerase [Flavipsychrobacter sp.]|nr:topoisomerase [Flavipsychrobacter sp.]